jgi:ketosteroid isomerase-like protein
MPRCVLLFTVAVFLSGYAAAQSGQPDPVQSSTDVEAIHYLIARYTKAVDTVDLNLLSQIWSHSPEVSFIYPLGEEYGFDAIERHVFEHVMGGMFSKRDLEADNVKVHTDGNTAWSEFHWVFHATLRKDGSAVVTRGVETQIYRKEAGEWRLIHVHYSEDRQSSPPGS